MQRLGAACGVSDGMHMARSVASVARAAGAMRGREEYGEARMSAVSAATATDAARAALTATLTARAALTTEYTYYGVHLRAPSMATSLPGTCTMLWLLPRRSSRSGSRGPPYSPTSWPARSATRDHSPRPAVEGATKHHALIGPYAAAVSSAAVCRAWWGEGQEAGIEVAPLYAALAPAPPRRYASPHPAAISDFHL